MFFKTCGILFVLIIFTSLLNCQASLFGNIELLGSTNSIGDLRNELLKNYNPSVRPVRNHYHNTTVKLGMSISSVELDEKDQILTVMCFLLVTWNDEYLVWDPAEKDNITSLHFDKNEIWMPDIALYNSARDAAVTPDSDLPVLAYQDGNVFWAPHFTAQVPCMMDISLWPSDKHTCSLRLGSWSHHGEQVNLALQTAHGINMQYYRENDRWKIIDYNATKKFSSYDTVTYHYILFQLGLQRLAASHAIYISQTTLTMIVIILSSFFLPLEFHLSRILLHLFALGGLVICNIIIFVTLPATSGHVPFVVKYYSGAMVVTTLSLLCQVIMANTITHVTDASMGIRGVFRSIIGFPQSSYSARNLVSEEISYSNLEEERLEPVESEPPEGTQQQRPPVVVNRVAPVRPHSTRIHDVHRVVNLVLFSMFSVSYIVDYAILRASIGY